MAEKIAVLGIYPNYASVENGVDVLKEAGFRNTDISVLFPEKVVSKDFAHKKHTRAPEGAAAGAGTGAILGGTLGWLVGIGALAIPGLGPFIAAGPIMAALAGVGVGGAVGGITGALIGMGIPEHQAKRYEVRVKEGGILPLGAFRQCGLDEARQGDSGADRSAGYLGNRRGRRRLRQRRQAGRSQGYG